MLNKILIAISILATGYFVYYKKAINTDDLSKIACFELEQHHIDALRDSKVTMNPIEGGSPMLAKKITDFIFPGNLFENNSLKSTHKNAIKGIAFDIFIDKAELNEGKYNFRNPFLNDSAHMKSIARTELVELYNRAQIEFNFTNQHAKLLQATDAGYENHTIGINPKRPYGDATAFEPDMADILGINLDLDAENNIIANDKVKQLFILHNELIPALQILLLEASIKTGKYCRDTTSSNWQRQNE